MADPAANESQTGPGKQRAQSTAENTTLIRALPRVSTGRSRPRTAAERPQTRFITMSGHLWKQKRPGRLVSLLCAALEQAPIALADTNTGVYIAEVWVIVEQTLVHDRWPALLLLFVAEGNPREAAPPVLTDQCCENLRARPPRRVRLCGGVRHSRNSSACRQQS